MPQPRPAEPSTKRMKVSLPPGCETTRPLPSPPPIAPRVMPQRLKVAYPFAPAMALRAPGLAAYRRARASLDALRTLAWSLSLSADATAGASSNRQSRASFETWENLLSAVMAGSPGGRSHKGRPGPGGKTVARGMVADEKHGHRHSPPERVACHDNRQADLGARGIGCG